MTKSDMLEVSYRVGDKKSLYALLILFALGAVKFLITIYQSYETIPNANEEIRFVFWALLVIGVVRLISLRLIAFSLKWGFYLYSATTLVAVLAATLEESFEPISLLGLIWIALLWGLLRAHWHSFR